MHYCCPDRQNCKQELSKTERTYFFLRNSPCVVPPKIMVSDLFCSKFKITIKALSLNWKDGTFKILV